jgi:sugar/nucleoside kinase (ribokinase family)
LAKKHDVVGICNALVDILIKVDENDVKHLGLNKGVMHLVDSPRQAEVLKYLDRHEKVVELGGSTLNALRTLAQLGKKTVFAGMVSDDTYGTRILTRMQELGIKGDLGRSHEPTGTCVILITPDGERTMNTNLGASRLYDEKQVPHGDIGDAQVLHFCGYQWDTDGQKKGVRHAIDSAKKAGTLVSFDVADPFAVGRNREAFLKVIEDDADIVFSNKEEAKMLLESTPEEAARWIASKGAVAVVKLGAEGAIVAKGNEVHRIAPVATKVIDTTAAGDMFAAGFLYGFTSGKPLAVCGKMAATIASDVISRIGATVSTEALDKLRAL